MCFLIGPTHCPMIVCCARLVLLTIYIIFFNFAMKFNNDITVCKLIHNVFGSVLSSIHTGSQPV